MFDVYKYIRSKDVREYNKKIEYKFNNKKWVCKFRRKFRSVLYLEFKCF